MPVAKLIDFEVVETSGVNHPAHMAEGWVVMKAAGHDEADAELRRMAGATNPKESGMSDNEPELSPEAQAVVKDRDEKIEALEKQVDELTEAVAKSAAGGAGDDDGDLPDEVVKSLPEPVRAAIAKAQADAEAATVAATEATEQLRKERDAAADREAVAKAKAWSNIGVDGEEFGPLLRKATQVDEDLGRKLESTLAAISAQVATGELFKEFGSGGGSGDDDTAERQIMSKAADLVAKGDADSIHSAVAVVAKTNPDLYERMRAENGA